MSPSVFDRFDANNAQEVMDKENYGQSPGVQTILNCGGRRFSDVTNTLQFSSSRKVIPESFHLAAHLNSKSNAENLHQEISYLKRVLAEKEANLESTKHELQKAWYVSYKSSQQNKQLAQTNGQMFAELCLLREKVKLLQHEYNSMSAAFRVKREELEQTVTDLSEQLQRRNQFLNKDPEQCENSLQSDSQHLCSIKKEESSEKPGEVSIGGQNSTRINLAVRKVKTNAKRVSIKRRLTSNENNGMTRQQLEEAESMATVNPIDESNASFSKNSLKEVFAGSFHKKDYRLLRENGSAKEEDSKDKRTCMGRELTSVSYKESPLHKKVRHVQKASTTLEESDQHIASTSMLKTSGHPYYSNNEGDCSEGAHVSINEETSNGKRLSLRRRSANIKYKEPALNTKLRREGPTISIQKLFQSDMQNTLLNAQGTLGNLSERDVCNEPDSFCTKLSAIEENKKCKRACSRLSSANTDNRNSHLKENAQQEQKTLLTPSFSQSQTLDNVGEGQKIGFDVRWSDAVHVELSESAKGCKNSNFTNKEDVTSYQTKVQQQQETGYCSTSALKTASEMTELRRSQSASSAPKTIELAGVIPRGGNVGEDQELHSHVPQPETADLSKTSKCPQGNKPPAVRQLKVQRTVPCHASSFNTALNAAELRRSLTGRPVRKAAETVASYKEIPVNIKMRRSQ